MQLQENVPVGPKTTMRIGGQARYFAELMTREDVEEAVRFAKEKRIPLIVLGGGSNTIFADGIIEAFVVRLKHDAVTIDENKVTVGAGKILASLLNDLAAKDLDLSPLTGIPGTVGGAVFGNAGQGASRPSPIVASPIGTESMHTHATNAATAGAGGIWISSFIDTVTVYIDGEWKTLTKDECHFRYRESWFKDLSLQTTNYQLQTPPVIWQVTLTVPSKPATDVQAEIERLIKRRIETQPHIKTAGSCFKSLPDGTPAWKLIDAAGLRGLKIGGIEVSEKHANFLLNVDKGTFQDALSITKTIKEKVPQITGVEMRFYAENGRIAA
ncbi:MAG: UDP-N-acetylmuramate dehydrogenase [Candidatus Peregrinibacteria bacterium Greene0416_19]|nr:MAG: UDP-N-acetylmuramate dehydrogenase [Candidatus Peregrinibacteria bacterium Greene0416_19]